MRDQSFRESVQKSMVVFLDRKYLGFFDFQHLRKLGDLPISFEIGESKYFQYKNTSIRLEKNDRHRYGTFKATGKNNFETTNNQITDFPVIIDTGSNITDLFPLKIWNFENLDFNKKLNNVNIKMKDKS